jgi:hypothetical protein
MIPLSSLSYLCDDCHKQAVTHIWESRRFESMYTMQRKIRPTCHTLSTLDLRMVQDHTSHVVHVEQPFASPHEIKISPYTRKKSWQPKTDLSSRYLGWPHSSSHATALELGKEVSAQWLQSYFSLLAHKHQHAVDTFNTCSHGPTHRSLTDTGGS